MTWRGRCEKVTAAVLLSSLLVLLYYCCYYCYYYFFFYTTICMGVDCGNGSPNITSPMTPWHSFTQRKSRISSRIELLLPWVQLETLHPYFFVPKTSTSAERSDRLLGQKLAIRLPFPFGISIGGTYIHTSIPTYLDVHMVLMYGMKIWHLNMHTLLQVAHANDPSWPQPIIPQLPIP